MFQYNVIDIMKLLAVAWVLARQRSWVHLTRDYNNVNLEFET